MHIYFATNRNPDSVEHPTAFGETFSVNGLTDLRFGWAKVNDDDSYELTVAAENLTVTPAEAAVGDLSKQVLGSKAVFEAIQAEMKEGQQDCVIYIHGFNTTFDEAIIGAARFKRSYHKRPMTVFLFSWPSNGALIRDRAYSSDRDDARASGVALGRGLQKLASFLRGSRPEDYCGQNVHLVAHSMGNYALRWALQNILGSTGSGLRRLLDQVLLFAADEDADAFEFDHKLAGLPDMARRVTVYHHARDKALLVSDITKGNPDRLGAGGPRNSRLLPDKVTVVNCQPVIELLDDLTSHHYHVSSKAVRRDVLGVLAGREPQDFAERDYVAEARAYRLRRAAE